MNCTELESLALDYQDGTLAAAERVALEAHISSCAGCATRLHNFTAAVSDVQQMMDAWPTMQPSRDFDRRVLDQIATQPAGASGLWRGLLAPFFASLLRPAFAGTLSAVLVAAFAVVRFLPSGNLPAAHPLTAGVSTADNSDEVTLVQDLTDLDDLEMLRNFEVLQEMKGPTP